MIKSISMRKRFMLRSFFRYFIIILLPVLLVAPYIMSLSYLEVNEGIEEENQRLLYQVESKLDTMQKNASNINFYFSKNTQAGYSAKSILRKNILKTDMNDSMSAILHYLQNFQNTDPTIHSIYVYYDNDYGRFFDSRSGIQWMTDFYDTTWFSEYLNSESDIWFSEHEVQEYSFAEPVPVVTVNRRLYSGSRGSEPDGIVTVNYKREDIEDYINNLSLYDNQTIVLLNEEGEVLAQNRELDIASVIPYLKGSAVKESGGEGNLEEFQIHMGKERYSVFLMSGSDGDYVKYVSLVPYKDLYRQTIMMSYIIGLSIAATFIISVILAWTSAKKDVRRLHEIVSLLNHEIQPGDMKKRVHADSGDPYNYILFNLLQMFLEQDYLKMQYSERKNKMEMLNLQVLQHQINPHFMNNTLNGIYWEAIRQNGGPNECSDMVEKLSVIMKYAMESSTREVTVQEEMTYLDTYLDIQTTRYETELRIEWDVDGEAREGMIPKMLLQPLIENSVYHGIIENQLQGRMKCHIRKRGEHLYFQIIDTGMGVSKEKEKEIRLRLQGREETEDHVGLYNTNLRLILRYGEEAGISFSSKYQMGTLVRFRIPYIK